MKHILVLTTLFFSLNIFSKDNYLYIKPLKTKYLTSYQVNELQKISLEYALKTGRYKILLTPIQLNLTNKNKFNNLQLTFSATPSSDTPKGSQINLKFSLIDKKRKKNIQIVRKKNVLPRKFIAVSKALLKELFFGKDYKKKRKKIKQNKIIQKDIKKTKSDPEITPPSLKTKKVDFNKNAKLFQKQSDDLKNEIDKELNSHVNNSKISKKAKQGNKNPNALAKISDKNLKKDNPNGGVNKFKIEKSYEYSIGYQINSQVISNTISNTKVTTKTNIESIPIGINMILSIPSNKRSSFKVKSIFQRIIASDNYELNTPYLIGLRYSHFPIYNSIHSFSLGPSYESLSFVSISNAGAGLKPATLKVFWFDFKININLPTLLNKPNRFGLSYSHSINAENDLIKSDDQVTYNAKKIDFNYEISLTKAFSVVLGYQGLTFSQANKNEFEGQDDMLYFKLNLI